MAIRISIKSVPISVHDAGRLTNFAGNQRQLFIGDTAHVDFDVQQIVR
jgi:hypothetical protein